ncbi:hypothetical protein QTA56_03125 [Acinetobacter sp. VNH17]|uniref:Uncharacterized protein n=2 Tax=Acinetobacter TaxID=469 RepID=A0ABT7WKL0_9GAMM|nr:MULTISPECIES: hypothetical protein [Acinetobacter]MCY6411129.1 hypothetical protein [Acinetobacter thutiue]MDN0013231.1 hypothetical protein [Acinetobacter thutiue]WHP06299.1 hypothetical protein QLH32_02175 [Acinetobacter sp. KCTC 92772]
MNHAILEQRLIELAHELDEQDLLRILSLMQEIKHHKEFELSQPSETLDLSKISIAAFADIQDPVGWQREIRDVW